MINRLAFGICLSILTLSLISFPEGKWIAGGQYHSDKNESGLFDTRNDSNSEAKSAPVINGSSIITPWNTGNKNNPANS